MTLPVTLAALAGFVALFAYCSWRAGRPADLLRPRLLPWRTLVLVAGVAALLMAVHLVNLLGVRTGSL